MADYKTQLHEVITELQRATKQGALPRELRLVKIGELTEEYFDKTGEMPDAVALERLADLCLYEELTDSNPDKMTAEEYPIASDTQLARRREGRHVKKDSQRKEVSFEATGTIGTDGKDYRMPTRKVNEELSDKKAKSRNAERRRNYTAFTKIQPVIVSKIR
jgi:hypothetical protein